MHHIINDDMNFFTFIEGESNRLARAMALSVSENPGGGYNPFYLYGGRGVGKSHLLNAIAHEAEGKGFRVTLCSGAALPKSILKHHPDMILIDDADRAGIHDLEWLYEFMSKGGQLVISGLLPPDRMANKGLGRLIDKRGRSADIQQPEAELRIAILKARAEAEGTTLPDDVAVFIADKIGGNTQKLIGALSRVRAVSSLSGQEITRFSATQALKEYL